MMFSASTNIIVVLAIFDMKPKKKILRIQFNFNEPLDELDNIRLEFASSELLNLRLIKTFINVMQCTHFVKDRY